MNNVGSMSNDLGLESGLSSFRDFSMSFLFGTQTANYSQILDIGPISWGVQRIYSRKSG